MRYIKIIIACFWWVSLNAQQNLVKFKNVDGGDYPNLKGEIWFRNPNTINTSSVTITENGKVKTLSLSNPKTGDSIAKNKVVIFLMVNPGPTRLKQFDWYRNVIASTLTSTYIKPGDKIQIMSFNQQFNGQLLVPAAFNFTDQTKPLNDQLRDMKPVPYQSTCGGSRTLIWSAIDQVLDLVEKEHFNLPVSIIVISDDNSCITQQANQTPAEKAKKLNVAIYGVSRNDKNKFNSIEKICTESFGSYFMESNNDLGKAETHVRNIMLNILVKAAGQRFDFSYETDNKMDGTSQPVTVTVPGSVVDTFIPMPSKNFFQKLIANWYILLVVILIVAGIFFYINKTKKEAKQKQFEIEEKSKSDYQRLKAEQEKADAAMAQQVADQERQMNQMRLKAQQEEEARRQQQKTENAEQIRKEKLQEMRLRGNLPWLIVNGQGGEFRYEIDDPLYTIGRENENSLCIPASTISRRHAVIKFDQGNYTIEDLGSSNGVIVNGEKLNNTILQHGDVIQLGDTYLTFMI